MNKLPEWVINPAHPDAPALMAADIAGEVARRKLINLNNAKQDAAPDFDKIVLHPRFQAEVAFDTMLLTAQLQATTDKSLNHQAAHVVEAQLHLAHPNEYETAEQFFAGALADTNRSKS